MGQLEVDVEGEVEEADKPEEASRELGKGHPGGDLTE